MQSAASATEAVRAEELKKAGSALDATPRSLFFGALLAFLIFPGVVAGQSDDLLNRVWDGIQQAQKKYTSMCGAITETRTSHLMLKPLVLRGKFCAEGTTRFALDYFEASDMHMRFNENYVNV